MRVPANQLGIQVLDDLGDVEVARLRGHLRVEEHLQQQVAKLVLQLRPRPALDGVEDLVGLLERVAFDGVKVLFTIPRAAIGGAQPGHDLDGLGEGVGRRALRLGWPPVRLHPLGARWRVSSREDCDSDGAFGWEIIDSAIPRIYSLRLFNRPR